MYSKQVICVVIYKYVQRKYKKVSFLYIDNMWCGQKIKLFQLIGECKGKIGVE